MRIPVNRVIDLGGIALQLVPVYFTNANQIVPVRHLLDSDAVGVLVASKDGTCDIWDAPASNTRTSVAVVCDTAGVKVTLLLVAVRLTER
jgi:hypothetical protein